MADMRLAQIRAASPAASRRALLTAIAPLAALSLTLSASASFAAAVALTLMRSLEDPDPVELTLADLEAMPQASIETESEFTDGPVTYRGPLVRDVLQSFGLAEADLLRFTAANDYYVEIPAEDFRSFDAILALEADGVKLSRRDKGPIWLMYPLSDHPELNGPLYNSRLIWQLTKIEAL